jgi:hypothetical protein
MTSDLPFARLQQYRGLAIGWLPSRYFCAAWLRRGYRGCAGVANATEGGKTALSMRARGTVEGQEIAQQRQAALPKKRRLGVGYLVERGIAYRVLEVL